MENPPLLSSILQFAQMLPALPESDHPKQNSPDIPPDESSDKPEEQEEPEESQEPVMNRADETAPVTDAGNNGKFDTGLWALGKTPIQGDQPAGTDAKFDPEYEALDEEIQKHSSASVGGAFSWETVAGLGERILREKSKDLKAAGYLAAALFHTQGITGFARGVKILFDMIDQFPEDLFPKREKGRTGAVRWWIQETEKMILAVYKPDPVPADLAAIITEYVDKLDRRLGEYLSDAPLLTGLRRFAETMPVESDPVAPGSMESGPVEQDLIKPDIIESGKKETPPAPIKQEKDADDSKKSKNNIPSKQPDKPAEKDKEASAILKTDDAPVIDMPGKISSENDAQAQFGKNVRMIGAFLKEKQPADFRAFRLTRIASWAMIKTLPVLKDADKKQTHLPPPPSQLRKSLETSIENDNWEALLKSAEQNLSVHIFWLDLNRYSAEALSNMGKGFEQAEKTVCQETAFFIHRFPDLQSYTFSDGAPFMDDQTTAWLSQHRIGTGNGSNKQSVSNNNDPKADQWMVDRFQKAQLLARQNKLVESVEYLQKEWKQSYTKREALLWRLALSQILISSKKANLAIPHLYQILQDIETYRLEDWDPDLAIEGLKVVWEGYNANPGEEFPAKSIEILNRITKIDPAEALRLSR